MTDSSGAWTRRGFLSLVGKVGGAAAVHETMTALGWMRMPEAWAGPPKLEQGSGKGRKVLILAAGIGGLTAAYELTRVGYECRILEAQDRAGGRSLTARRGTVITEESPENGVTHQRCQFDEGLYLNMGLNTRLARETGLSTSGSSFDVGILQLEPRRPWSSKSRPCIPIVMACAGWSLLPSRESRRMASMH